MSFDEDAAIKQAAMPAEICQCLERVIDIIAEIDQECRTKLGDIEFGLANVKLELRDRALRETGKKLTEERLVAWLVQQKLDSTDRQVRWELAYTGTRVCLCPD